jgi:DNA-binding Xre family transcriptional regulator
MSQRQAAKASGVGLSTISRLCTNSTATVALDVLDRLAVVLKVRPGDLIVADTPRKPRRR